MRTVLFKTIHGSHLYGLSHADSDQDWFVVVTKEPYRRIRYAKQSIVDDLDTTTVDLGTFMEGCRKGVPQYLEAMMSQSPTVDLLGPLRAGYRASTGVYDTYLRTIKSMALEDNFKQKRHALRLAINLNEICATGRFNPRLAVWQVSAINSYANNLDNEDLYRKALQIAWATHQTLE